MRIVIPQKTNSSGIILLSRSMTNIAIMIEMTTIIRGKSAGETYLKKIKKRRAVETSTKGYLREILLPQARHLPLRRKKDSSGMLSNQAIRLLHCGQKDRPERTLK